MQLPSWQGFRSVESVHATRVSVQTSNICSERFLHSCKVSPTSKTMKQGRCLRELGIPKKMRNIVPNYKEYQYPAASVFLHETEKDNIVNNAFDQLVPPAPPPCDRSSIVVAVSSVGSNEGIGTIGLGILSMGLGTR